MVQNDKKLCPWCSISQEPYIMWLSFMVHLCKMIISRGIFYIFSKFWISGSLGGKRVKNGSKWQKFSLSYSISQELYILWLWFLVRASKMIFVASSFIFSKFCFCWFLGELKGKKTLKLSISSYHVLYLRNCRLYKDFWYTAVK